MVSFASCLSGVISKRFLRLPFEPGPAPEELFIMLPSSVSASPVTPRARGPRTQHRRGPCPVELVRHVGPLWPQIK